MPAFCRTEAAPVAVWAQTVKRSSVTALLLQACTLSAVEAGACSMR